MAPFRCHSDSRRSKNFRWTLPTAVLATFLVISSVAAATTKTQVRVIFAVLLPEQVESPATNYPCSSLKWAEAEQTLIAQDIQQRFGNGWSVVTDDRGERSITTQSLGDSVVIRLKFQDTGCSDSDDLLAVVDLFRKEAIKCRAGDDSRSTSDVITTWVFFGPCCQRSLSSFGRSASSWNAIFISPGGMTNSFGSHTIFPQIVGILPPYDRLASFIRDLTSSVGWSRVAFLYHDDVDEVSTIGLSQCRHIIDAVSMAMDEMEARISTKTPDWATSQNDDWFGSTVASETGYSSDQGSLMNADEVNSTVSADEDDQQTPYEASYKRGFDENLLDKFYLDEILSDIIRLARIVITCASQKTVRKIMLQAAEKKLNTEDFVFINIDLLSSQSKLIKPWYDADDSDDNNNKARRVYESLITVAPYRPDSDRYTKYLQEVDKNVKSRSGDPSTYADEDLAANYVGVLHDSVLLYALALNETMAAGFDLNNSSNIARHTRNMTFEGVTGTVNIDENGDRHGDYSLLDLNPETGIFEVVVNYHGKSRNFVRVDGKSIHWSGGRTSPPSDRPKCTFDGSHCSVRGLPVVAIVFITLGLLFLILAPVAVMLYKFFAQRRRHIRRY